MFRSRSKGRVVRPLAHPEKNAGLDHYAILSVPLA